MALENKATIAAAAVAVGTAAVAHRTRNKTLAGVAALAAAAVAALIAASRNSRRGLRAFARYPRQYVARRGTIQKIDGDVFKPAWERLPWSEPFVEIRGEKDAPEGTGPTSSQETRMKMMWDDEYLYIACIMDFDVGDEIIAKFKERNSAIFHSDSDMEVFIDPAGCTHGYKEFEMNAINTVWNLMLSKTYIDGGGELSGREHKKGDANFWEVYKQKTATRVTKGSLHDPSKPSQWVCELAFHHSDTLSLHPQSRIDEESAGRKPAVGEFWRINFSRVEKKGDVNWVWSPQIVWDPHQKRHAGMVNMHLPDAWGYVVFADEDGKLSQGLEAETFKDPSWPARHAAACVYYACRAFREAHDGRAPKSFQELKAFDNGSLIEGADLEEGSEISISTSTADRFFVVVRAAGYVASIDHERFLTSQAA
eukprot:TRINITY_DN5063_c0_g2_i1.p1 TRINITY_DN5063_c0_g2~~TRINITY_DN5063_c0_g2_i1.p1  ORF type:complete len:424 (-),score=95.92 TRINITY_DN5063_c0_g2_i1:447-1718(-)